MKVKELESTVNVVWSPQSYCPVMLATGSAAQHVDASFSSSSSIDLYSLNLGDPGYEMEQKVSLPSEHKFQKLVWSSGGVMVGGCDSGLLQFFNVDSLLKKKEALIASNTKHTGSVSALDLNPFQNNLLASGASESEIYIWDLNNTSTPMAPGNKSQPLENVQAVAWNRQVQHILASAFSTRCVVWDLRKNEPIIKLSDGQSRTRWKSTAWHPSVATQLCIASEDDQNPVIQLWDLRLATSPLLTLEGHHKGVLALSWCQQDPDLLLSAGKDGRVLCWNPNNNSTGGELLLEVCSTGQWMYDVSWCPKNPNLLSTCSNDGRVGVFSINGGTHHQQVATTNKIMDSFPGMESLQQAPVVTHAEVEPSPQILPRPPQWTRRPIKASFGFGGKLVTFENHSDGPQRQVFISQVSTEPELIEQARVLQEVIGAAGSEGAAILLSEHCLRKANQTNDQHEKYVWHFLRASFEQDPRAEMLNLLGFRQDDMNSKMNSLLGKLNVKNQPNNIDGHVEQITDRLAGLSRSVSSETDAEPSTDTSTDASGIDGTAAFDTIAQNNKVSNEVESEVVKPPVQLYTIPTGDDSEGLICQALLSGNIEAAVEFCLEAGRTADALIIASSGGGDLLQRTQWRYLSGEGGPVKGLAAALVGGEWAGLAGGAAPSSWRAALAAALTHGSPQQLYEVCEIFGEKLEKESDGDLRREAVICYLCSASVEPLVTWWRQQLDSENTSELTHVVEMVLIARLAASTRGRPVQACGKLSNLLTSYAMRLASQGHLEGALYCLSGLQDQELTHRLQCALGYAYPYSTLNRQNVAKPAPVQTQWSSGGRVRTSSYNQATQPLDPWSASVQQPPYMTNSINQVPVYNPGVDKLAAPPAGFPPQPGATAQPPRPASASSHGGLLGRNKHVRDPSVQSGVGSFPLNPIDSQPAFGNRQLAFNNQQPFSNNQQFNAPPTFNPGPAYNPMQPNTSVPPLVPMQSNTISNSAPSSYPSDNVYNGGASNAGYYRGTEAASDALQSNIHQSAPGWNDPPVLTSSHKKEMSAEHAGTRQWGHIISHSRSEAKHDYSGQVPITHPLFGSAPAQQGPGGPPQFSDQIPASMNQGFGAPMNQNHGPPMNQNFGPPISQNFGAPVSQNFGATLPPTNQMPIQQVPVEAAPPPLPPTPAQKAPIPEQHIHMQTVFDALRAQCAQSTNNPQIKRKLDDVQRKLEILYDLLREHRLSENATNALHCVVQMIQGGDYAGALAALTSLAGGSDFAAVASFLPSLKVMIQTASNAQIYLR